MSVRPPRRIILVVGSGSITNGDYEALVERLRVEPALAEGLPVLVDARDALAEIPLSEVPRVVTMAQMLSRRGMGAIAIVARQGRVLTLAKVFEFVARSVGERVAVFGEIDEARGWLGLDA